MASTRVYRRSNFSMGIQNASSWLLRQPAEVEDSRNVRYNDEIGAAIRRNGYVKSGSPFSTTNKKPTGFHTAQFTTGARKLVACNNDAGTFTIVRAQNPDGTWTTIISDIPVNADVYFCDYRDEVYVSGVDVATQTPFQPRNIDKTLNVSTTRNLLFSPWPKFYAVYKNLLYACHVSVNGEVFRDRIYKGSAPTGAVTFVRGPQTDAQVPLTYVNQVPAMTSATTPAGAVAHSSVNGAFAGWKIFAQSSNRVSGSWITPDGTNTGWVSYDFGAAQTRVITHYALRPVATDGTTNDFPAAPRNWALQGSNDGSTWTDVHTVSAAPVFFANEERTYTTTNTTAYRYYRINVTAIQGALAPGTNLNRVTINGLKLFTTVQTTRPLQLKIDSVRYIKTGMNLEIYKSGKNIKLYDITVFDVDKPNNTIQFLPSSNAISAVTVAADTITISNTSKFPTGTPMLFTSTSGLPAPLAPGITYYAININATTLKVATTFDNATIGQAIDLTTAGSGTLGVLLSYVLNNNDEIYLAGRYGLLTTFWNTDYPTPDKADWSAVQPGSDSNNVITGVKESGNRLFVFTLNSGSRFDGSNMVVFSKTVGCVSHRTIQNIDDDWMLWMTARKRVYARNEAASQQEYISRGVANKFFNSLTLDQIKTASAGITDNEYTVFVGEYKGEPHRAQYDFGSNTWAIDAIGHNSYMYANDSSSGDISPFFVSDNGNLYQDDIGDLDDDKAIRYDITFGRVNYGTESDKEWLGAFIYSSNAVGLKVMIKIDDKDWITISEIKKSYGRLMYDNARDRETLRGSTINIRVAGALKGPAQSIEAFHDLYTMVQEINGHGQEQ